MNECICLATSDPHIVCDCRKPAAWDPEILRAVKGRDQSAVLYTARPATLRANQVPYELKESRANKKSSVPASAAGNNGKCPALIYLIHIWLRKLRQKLCSKIH